MYTTIRSVFNHGVMQVAIDRAMEHVSSESPLHMMSFRFHLSLDTLVLGTKGSFSFPAIVEPGSVAQFKSN
jgi:hypothetical protein